MLGKAIQPEIEEMITARSFETLRETLTSLDVADVAEILDDLNPEQRAVTFRILPREFASDVFEDLPLEDQEQLISDLSAEVLGDILNAMSPDDRTKLLEELPAEVTQRLLRTLNPDERKVANTLLGYQEESIGRLMTPEYIAAQPGWTVQETLDFVRKTGAEAETLSFVYIVDDRGRLIDDLYLGRLVMADPATKLRDMVRENVVVLSADQDQEEAVVQFKKYDRVALPVVDRTGVMLGIVTFDDVMDIDEEEATEDMAKFAASGPLEDSYMAASRWMLVRARAGWLSVLFVGGYITALALEQFAGLLREFVILSFFIPLVISTGGNSGSQSASLIIRGLATQQVGVGDWRKILTRELAVGLALGCFLGSILGLIILLRSALGIGNTGVESRIALVAFISVSCIVTLGSLFGALLPLFFKRFGFDPAVSSAPFIATFVDLSGIIFYLGLAQVFLRYGGG